ncbi:LysR family transcriptional regulator [Klebsiella pneumoniae subsp. pneumoniae]|nr:LysR family transcriptional regulator [Klebsiella pneumoniae subsp. pneumoniae]
MSDYKPLNADDKTALGDRIVLPAGTMSMDKLDTLTLFVRIVERGSFSAAAADLGVSRPVATAAIKALEVSLGARLLHRTTRHVRPTAEGSLYYQRCVSILAALEEANRSAGGASPAPFG